MRLLIRSLCGLLLYAAVADHTFRVGMEELTPDGLRLRVDLPPGFTNQVEFFVSSDMASNQWALCSGILKPGGTNQLFWTDQSVSNKPSCFYRVGNADLDSDGDTLSDARELLLYGTASQVTDSDYDHISDAAEVNIAGLDPLNPDSDGDGLPDGEELRWGFTSAMVPDDLESDADLDGLSLAQEYAFGTNPGLNDTDGDGAFDGLEAGQGSDPTDGADGGAAPETNNSVRLSLSIDGGGPNEIFMLKVGKRRILSGMGTNVFNFIKGISMNAEVALCGSLTSAPEYGYDAVITETGGGTNSMFIDDPAAVLGIHSGGEPYSSTGQVAEVMIPRFEYTIFVDQPIAGSRTSKYVWKNGTVFTGHSWWNISVQPARFVDLFLTDPGRIMFANMKTGFYPENYPNHDLGKNQYSVPGELFYPDPEGRFTADVIKSFNIEYSGFIKGLDRVVELNIQPGTFDLNLHNCSDVALEIAALCGHVLPDTYGSWPLGGGGTNPADLGEDLRLLP